LKIEYRKEQKEGKDSSEITTVKKTEWVLTKSQIKYKKSKQTSQNQREVI
jgi:hypothetical protein